MKFITVWECDRVMGGPEEGGWSYEVGTLTTVAVATTDDEAERIREALEARYPYTGQRGMYSKRGPDYSVRIMDPANEYDREQFDQDGALIPFYPITTPHYE